MVSMSSVDLEGLNGYLASPNQKSGIGLLIVHAWWGLNEFFKSLANKLAKEGFVVFVPDYYNGEVAKSNDEATNLRDALDMRRTGELLTKSVDFLKQHPDVIGDRIGVLGVSLGAWLSIDLAQKRTDDIGAVVLFYGVGGGTFDSFDIPIQCHFAETEEWEPADYREEFEKRLSDAEVEFDFYTYPNTTHWFIEENVTAAYRPEAANLALRRSIEFLKARLKA